MNALKILSNQVIACEICPRLRDHARHVAQVKRRAYLHWDYWGKPIPGFGDPTARLLVIGLAPGAHGANRTGRVFTGDRSGDFLYRALYETGFATQAESTSRDDGLKLSDVYITAAVRCAPPDNKPTPEEFRNCSPYLEREIAALKNVRVVVALGALAFHAYLDIIHQTKAHFPFGHNREHQVGPGRPILISSYHPSQQNTSTGKLTAAMLRSVFERVAGLKSRAG